MIAVKSFFTVLLTRTKKMTNQNKFYLHIYMHFKYKTKKKKINLFVNKKNCVLTSCKTWVFLFFPNRSKSKLHFTNHLGVRHFYLKTVKREEETRKREEKKKKEKSRS